MTIVLNLPPDKEAELQARAAAMGQGVDEYVLAVALPEAASVAGQKSVPPPYDPAAAIALLDAFATSDKYGTAEDQRETLAYLERVVDEDRPGQRSAFGKGYNPPAGATERANP